MLALALLLTSLALAPGLADARTLLAARHSPPSMLAKRPASLKKKKGRVELSSPKGFGVAVAKPDNPLLSPAAAEGPAGWAELAKWLVASGASCEAVELYVGKNGLRGVRTTRRVKRGDELMRIPRSIILDENIADASPVSRIWSESSGGGASVHPPPPAYARLALMLLYERQRGEASPYAKYINLLPSADDFAKEGGPTVLWSDEDLQLLECDKLIGDTRTRRERVETSPVIGVEALQSRWEALELGGPPPSLDDIRWAVAAVTSRAYGAQNEEGARLSLLIPMVDMANHAHPPNTAKGLEGSDFVVLAAEDMSRGAQVFLSYGPLPNQVLLSQFGFVLPSSPTDFALVRCDALASAGNDPSMTAAIDAAAEAGLLMRDSDAGVSVWQPATLQLREAFRRLAESGALPLEWAEAAKAAGVGESAGVEEVGAAAYTALLKKTLGSYSSSVGDDKEALEVEELRPRTRLALLWRVEQKAMLNRELAMVASGGLASRVKLDEILRAED